MADSEEGRGAGRRPNVVLVMVDDLGFSDLSCYGSEIDTPNLDALAASGARLTQLYNDARCCPSRASLLTGLAPHQAGMGHMVWGLGIPEYQGFLSDHVVTAPEALRDGGYRTLMLGKWHLGGAWLPQPDEWRRLAGSPGFPRPVDRGFDHHFGTLSGAGSYFDPHTLVADTTPVQAVEPDFYYTDALGEHAADAIDGFARQPAATAQPFFLYLAPSAPHWPLHAPVEDVERFRGRYERGWDATRTARHERAIAEGVVDGDWPISPRDPGSPPWESVEHKGWEDARMAVYAAQIHALDRAIGRIMDALRRNDLERDTIVVFLSDNGGAPELLQEEVITGMDIVVPTTRDGRTVRIGNHVDLLPGPADTYMSYGPAWANVSNTPLRLFKTFIHEGGISTPCIASWPGVIPAGTVVPEPCHITDLMPTFLEAAGVPHPEHRAGRAVPALEGESLLPLLAGRSWQRGRPIIWEHEGNRGVRAGRWKLVSRWQYTPTPASGPWELYDIERDRTELTDLAARHPDRVREMAAAWEGWAARCHVRPWAEMHERLVQLRTRGC